MKKNEIMTYNNVIDNFSFWIHSPIFDGSSILIDTISKYFNIKKQLQNRIHKTIKLISIIGQTKFGITFKIIILSYSRLAFSLMLFPFNFEIKF